MATVKYEIYIMNVPFAKDYKHILLFDNEADQTKVMKAQASYHYTNLNVIVKNTTFIISGDWSAFNRCNYMMYRYKDSEQSNYSKWFYAFIDDVAFDSYKGTLVTHTIDVWQTYHLTANFHQAYIERGHIKRGQNSNGDDIFGRWLAPEPVGFPSEFDREVLINNHSVFTALDFTPTIYVDTLSAVDNIPTTIWYKDNNDHTQTYDSYTGRYVYGGILTTHDSFNDFSGIFRNFPIINNAHSIGLEEALQKLVEMYTLPENPDGLLQWDLENYTLEKTSRNHLQDILCIGYLPKFLSPSDTQSARAVLSKEGYAIGRISKTYEASDNANVSINKTSGSLACGYNPRNKKMYTSLARAYKIWNKNGVSIPLAPELNKTSTTDASKFLIKINIKMHSYSDIMKVELVDYNSTNRIIDLPYNYNIQYGINANVGVTQQSNINYLDRVANLNAIKKDVLPMKLVSSALNVGAGAFNVATNLNGISEGMLSQQDLNYGTMGFNAVTSGIGAISSGINTVADYPVKSQQLEIDKFSIEQAQQNALNSISMSIGTSNTSRTNMTEEFWRLRLIECSPNYDECRQLDEFLDRYGYAINEVRKLNYHLKARRIWNYIKTRNARIETLSPSNENQIFNQIFDSGTTVWRDISKMGNYDFANNYTNQNEL